MTIARCHRIVPTLLAMCAALVSFAGCATDPRDGYAAMSMWSDDMATVHIPIFENRTFDRAIEFDLTEAIVKELEARTPYRVAPITRADATLTGTIVDVQRRQLSRSRGTGLGEETVVSVTVDFEYKDLRTGHVLVRREAFTGHGLFHPSPPAAEPIELGRTAAVQQLARDIVSELRESW